MAGPEPLGNHREEDTGLADENEDEADDGDASRMGRKKGAKSWTPARTARECK